MRGDRSARAPGATEDWPQEDQGLDVVVVSAVRDGQVSPLFVARPEQAHGVDPFRGYIVESSDPVLRRRDVDELVRAMHRGSGPVCGITSTTLRLKGGAPQGLRVTLPADGAGVLQAGELATGMDLGLARAALAAGATPSLVPRRRGSAGVRVLYPPADLTLDGLWIEPTALHGGIWEVELLARPGQLVRPPAGTCRGTPLALGFAVGENGEACRRALDHLPRALRVQGHRP